ncbi:MAG: hypothetical protein ACK4OM_07125 [Alphaproteobacteria bacterium]
MRNTDNSIRNLSLNIFKYLFQPNNKIPDTSLIFSIKKIFLTGLFVIVLSISSLIAFITYTYSEELYNEINQYIHIIEDELENQISLGSEILNRASEHISYLFENNSSNEEIEKFLASLEPRNLSKTYWSTLIITDKNLKFKASSKYSTPSNVESYNKELPTRKYIQESKNSPLKLHVGEIVIGVQTKKLSIPMGYGFEDKNKKYLGTLLTGLVIEDFIKDLSKESVLKISFAHTLPTSKSITNYSKLSLFKDIILLPKLIIHHKLVSVPEFIEISFDRPYYINKIYKLVSNITLILSIIIIFVVLTVKYFYKKIICPMTSIQNKLNQLEKFSPTYSLPSSTSNEPIEIQRIEAIIKKLINTDDELKKVKSIVKFLSHEKINEIEKYDAKGLDLFSKIKAVNNYINNKTANNENETPPQDLLKNLCYSIENFYDNFNAAEDIIAWELFNNMDELSEIIDNPEFNLTNNFSKKFLDFNNSLVKYYKEKVRFSPYLLNKDYFSRLEAISTCNIQTIIEDLLKKYSFPGKPHFECNIKGDINNLQMRKKAFEISFVYAVEAIEAYYSQNFQTPIYIEINATNEIKQNFILDIFINPNTDIKYDFVNFEQENLEFDDKTKINLYGAKIFAAFNAGVIRAGLDRITRKNMLIRIEFLSNEELDLIES